MCEYANWFDVVVVIHWNIHFQKDHVCLDLSAVGVMEEIIDDDFDDQNTADGSNLDHSGDVDQANMRDDAVGCFKSHTGTVQLKTLGPR